ncbi:MAG: polysaccharide deacetylase family protein [Tissierellia bacterium]|nr:polysaccharide deacetylase family protein [Tissierellia bacterium]
MTRKKISKRNRKKKGNLMLLYILCGVLLIAIAFNWKHINPFNKDDGKTLAINGEVIEDIEESKEELIEDKVSEESQEEEIEETEKESVEEEPKTEEVKTEEVKIEEEPKAEENTSKEESASEKKVEEEKTPKKEAKSSDEKKVDTPIIAPKKVEAPVKSDAPHEYSSLSNEEKSWWFRVPKTLNQGVKATIDSDIANVINKYDGIWQANTDKKVIYITMDEGYEFEENTSKILDIAKEKNFKITFFITGGFARQRPDLVTRMSDEGHLIGNHTDNHKNEVKAVGESVDVLKKDITDLEKIYKDLTGRNISKYMRPPEGVYSERTLAVIKDLGYKPVFWSFAYKDWDTKAQPNVDEALNKIVGQAHGGSVMLLHAVSKTNVELLPELIDTLREQGYVFDTIDNI